MPALGNYYDQVYGGNYGGYGGPPPPPPGRGGMTGGNGLGTISNIAGRGVADYFTLGGNEALGNPVGNAFEDVTNSIFGGPHKKKVFNPATAGSRDYHKGIGLLNAYNWLLPGTASTVERGANIFGDIYRNQASKSKAYELAQFSDFAPRYAQAILNADPRQARLLELYNQTLGTNLGQSQDYANRLQSQLDNPMSAASYRDITQASLGDSALKGFGSGARDAALAYINTGLQGEQLQRQREQQYMAALGLLGQNTQALTGGIQANKSVLGDPFLAFAGRPGQPQGSNPQSPDYGAFNNDLFSYSVNQDITNQNLRQARAAGNQQLIGSIVGSVLGAGGKVAGGLI